MKISLACLAALVLPCVALADHYICTRVFEPNLGQMVHVVIIGHHRDVIMRESKNFFSANHFTIKNSRGRFDMRRLGKTWSAAFDGVDWGTYTFQENINSLSTFRLGCYGNSEYCSESSQKALKKQCYDLLG